VVLLRRLALASLVANVVIVITGGAVRLTGSGLGCPTWPKCTDQSYVTTSSMGVHGVIEFGNRMLGGIVGLIAVATLLVVLVGRQRRLIGPAVLVAAGVAVQGAVGGLSVRTELNPWVVAGHFLLSMGVLAAAYVLWRRVSPVGRDPVPGAVRGLAVALTGAALLVLALGTVVTGSGPHAGDENARRLGYDPQTVAQLHADAVFLLIGLSIAAWFALRAVGARTAARAAMVLLAVELAQGAIGFTQYALHLPVVLVALHMAGACAVWLATLDVLARVGRPTAVPEPRTTAAESAPLAAAGR